jgi:hypothetical protein
LPGLGPHLSSCFREEGKGTTPILSKEAETLADQLTQILKDVRFDKAEAVLNLVESYGYNVLGIYAALKDSGARLSVIRYVIKRWASYNNEDVPEWMLREINTPQIPGGLVGYQLSGEEPLTEKRLLEILERKEKEKEEKQRLAKLEAEVSLLRSERMTATNPGKSEIQQLREEIAGMRQNEILNRLNSLERGITTTSDPAIQLIKSCENILKDVRADVQPFKRYVLYGNPFPFQTPPQKEIEEGAGEGIFNRLNKKYVSEE